MISVVQNNGKAGIVYYLENQSGTVTQLWSQATLSNPNSTSLDASGEHVTVADGYTPNGKVGHFYLFNGTSGNLLWSYETLNMNWPMFINSLGTGIAAGTDVGNVYYFTPD
jgi:outer membrane protein assembly factor BamB